MGSRKTEKVEYKDTFSFVIFPPYEYTAFQKKRFRMFQADIRHRKKIISYADKFDGENVINLIYMLGYHPQLKELVEKTEHHVCVLSAQIPADLLKSYDQCVAYFEKRGDTLTRDGVTLGWNSQGLCQIYNSYLSLGMEPDQQTADPYKELQDYIAEWNRLCAEIPKYYKRFTIIDKLHPEKTIDHKDIDKIIKRYFPKGLEQCCTAEKTVRSPKMVENAAIAGYDGADFCKELGVRTDEQKDLLEQNVKRAVMNINTAIRAEGVTELGSVFEQMKSAPYGWGSDAFSAYCYARALKLSEQYRICDVCHLHLTREAIIHEVIAKCRGLYTPVRAPIFFLYLDESWHINNRIAFILGTEPIQAPLAEAVISYIELAKRHTRIPLSMIDPILREIFCGKPWGNLSTKQINSRQWKYESESWLFVKEWQRRTQKALTWEKCKEYAERYQHINEEIPLLLQERYPDFPVKTYLEHFLTTDSCWVWNEDAVEEGIRNFLSDEQNRIRRTSILQVMDALRNHGRYTCSIGFHRWIPGGNCGINPNDMSKYCYQKHRIKGTGLTTNEMTSRVMTFYRKNVGFFHLTYDTVMGPGAHNHDSDSVHIKRIGNEFFRKGDTLTWK